MAAAKPAPSLQLAKVIVCSGMLGGCAANPHDIPRNYVVQEKLPSHSYEVELPLMHWVYDCRASSGR